MKPLRSRKHLIHVAEHYCIRCAKAGLYWAGRVVSQSHHLLRKPPKDNGRFKRGWGLKPSDEYTIPLCEPCHRDVHRRGDDTEYAWAAKKLALSSPDNEVVRVARMVA